LTFKIVVGKRFQFLLVRLRGLDGYLHKSRTKISIPSGAIKSKISSGSASCTNKISIPSGAIKRIVTGKKIDTVEVFQFLLVRLRVSSLFLTWFHRQVFQFLLVRLRGSPFSPFNKASCSFQFLLVRLREERTDKMFAEKPEFQFLLVRLRVGISKLLLLAYVEFQFLLVRLRVKLGASEHNVIRYFNSFWCD